MAKIYSHNKIDLIFHVLVYGTAQKAHARHPLFWRLGELKMHRSLQNLDTDLLTNHNIGFFDDRNKYIYI